MKSFLVVVVAEELSSFCRYREGGDIDSLSSFIQHQWEMGCDDERMTVDWMNRELDYNYKILCGNRLSNDIRFSHWLTRLSHRVQLETLLAMIAHIDCYAISNA